MRRNSTEESGLLIVIELPLCCLHANFNMRGRCYSVSKLPKLKTAVPGWMTALLSPFNNYSERLERTKPKLLPHLSPTVLPKFSDTSYILFR